MAKLLLVIPSFWEIIIFVAFRQLASIEPMELELSLSSLIFYFLLSLAI